MRTYSQSNWMRFFSFLVIFSIFGNLLIPVISVSAAAFSNAPEEPGVSQKLDDLATGMRYGSGWEDTEATTEVFAETPVLSQATAEETGPPVEAIDLGLSLNPAIIVEGKPVELHWMIKGWSQFKDEADKQIRVYLPAGLTPSDSAYAEELALFGFVTIQPITPAGKLSLTLEPEAIPPLDILAKLFTGGLLAVEEYVVLDGGKHQITTGGGVLNAMNGKVKVTVPQNAAAQDLVFDVRHPGANKLPAVSLTGRPMEIIAVGKTTGKNVTSFDEPISIQMAYEEDQIWDWHEEDLMLFYFDEATHDWWPLPTTVDAENNTLTAETDHLTVFDYQAASWQQASLPSVSAFQVSQYTGAGTYSMSFWTPPGPGGLQPNLNLNYNSQIIDVSTLYSQASWVGMGWSLDTGYIARNMNGTDGDTSDDTFSLNAAGVSSVLLPVSVNGTVTTYETSDQSFMHIEHDSSSNVWTLWAKNGTKYSFADRARTHTSNGCSTTFNLTWRWSLTSTEDVFGNEITYTYDHETKPGCSNEIAVYPKYINYPNNQYRIEFVRENRTDYQSSWSDSASRVLYETDRLKVIFIQKYDAGNWTTIRRYRFTYSSSTANQIYPNFTWSAGGRTLTLVQVQEKNGDGTTTLPAVSFSYDDDEHMTLVNNG